MLFAKGTAKQQQILLTGVAYTTFNEIDIAVYDLSQSTKLNFLRRISVTGDRTLQLKILSSNFIDEPPIHYFD